MTRSLGILELLRVTDPCQTRVALVRFKITEVASETDPSRHPDQLLPSGKPSAKPKTEDAPPLRHMKPDDEANPPLIRKYRGKEHDHLADHANSNGAQLRREICTSFVPCFDMRTQFHCSTSANRMI